MRFKMQKSPTTEWLGFEETPKSNCDGFDNGRLLHRRCPEHFFKAVRSTIPVAIGWRRSVAIEVYISDDLGRGSGEDLLAAGRLPLLQRQPQSVSNDVCSGHRGENLYGQRGRRLNLCLRHRIE